MLDSRHADVRIQGIAWFRSEVRAREDVTLWRRLAESPYDDVRLFLISELEGRVAGRASDAHCLTGLNAETLRLLWASVLLNIHRGSRAKPTVVRQIVRAIERRGEDAESLLPLMAAGRCRVGLVGRSGGRGWPPWRSWSSDGRKWFPELVRIFRS